MKEEIDVVGGSENGTSEGRQYENQNAYSQNCSKYFQNAK